MLTIKTPKIVNDCIVEWRTFCKKNNINKIKYCLHFLKKFKNVDYLILGFSNINQLNQINKFFKQKNISNAQNNLKKKKKLKFQIKSKKLDLNYMFFDIFVRP